MEEDEKRNEELYKQISESFKKAEDSYYKSMDELPGGFSLIGMQVYTLRKVQKILPLALRSENLFSNLKSYFRPPYWISFEKTHCFCDILKAKMSENSECLNPQSRVSNVGSNKEVNYIEIITGFGNIYT